MIGTKQIALRRPRPGKAFLAGWIPLSLVVSLLLAASAQAQRLPLPPGEQDAVNESIVRGVDYLKRTQQKSGTWAPPKVGHRIAYAVLPGLTLLECGVPAKDPIIQRAAHYLRARADKLDTTYELSLGILFLDRLGDPRDEQIIQTFALRLIAGQSTTGGWGYKCPLLGKTPQKELLMVLRHLDPPPDMPLVAGGQPGMPGIAGKPGDMPAIAGKPGDMPAIAGKPGDQPGLAERPAANPGNPAGIAKTPAGQPFDGTTGSTGSPSLSGGTTSTGSSPGASLSSPELTAPQPDRWRDWLGFSKPDGKAPKPAEKDAGARVVGDPPKPDAKDAKAPPKPDKPFVIPERLRMMTVLQDPALNLLLQDPRGKGKELILTPDMILTTTDNSNTQFAILALWTAQRHDVPMRRTLNLIVRRYMTSQNVNGTWNYHYRFGGAAQHESFSSPGAMTCVGLIGLAVGHGMAQPLPAGQLVQDPRILKALTALYHMIGKPSDRLARQPMTNLYFLWSVERVAVLYNLPAIGDKDWYRWGAQVLVTNQAPHGNWSGGQYHGSSETLDTCLALLFLKRANLVKDLTAKLPFKAAELNNSIMETLMPKRTPPSAPVPEPAEPTKKTLSPVEPPRPVEKDNLLGKPLSSLNGTAQADAPETESASSGGSKRKWIVLSLLVFVLFAGGSLFFFLVLARRDRDEEEQEDKKKTRRQGDKETRRQGSMRANTEQ